MYSTLKKKKQRKISITGRELNNPKKQPVKKCYYLKTSNRYDHILDFFDFDFLIEFSEIGLSSNKKESSQALSNIVLKLESEKTNLEILSNER